jgi:predicted HicB family RNase H-like nuclease
LQYVFNTKRIEFQYETADHTNMKRQNNDEKKVPENLVTRASTRVPLSARVKEETKEALAKAADGAGTSLSDLAAAILDDYAEWLMARKKRG